MTVHKFSEAEEKETAEMAELLKLSLRFLDDIIAFFNESDDSDLNTLFKIPERETPSQDLKLEYLKFRSFFKEGGWVPMTLYFGNKVSYTGRRFCEILTPEFVAENSKFCKISKRTSLGNPDGINLETPNPLFFFSPRKVYFEFEEISFGLLKNRSHLVKHRTEQIFVPDDETADAAVAAGFGCIVSLDGLYNRNNFSIIELFDHRQIIAQCDAQGFGRDETEILARKMISGETLSPRKRF